MSHDKLRRGVVPVSMPKEKQDTLNLARMLANKTRESGLIVTEPAASNRGEDNIDFYVEYGTRRYRVSTFPVKEEEKS